MLNTPLLNAFVDGFFGYGNLDAKLWFVGMEEGGGTTEQEVQARMDIWAARGRPVVDDVAEFHRDFGQPKWFEPRAPTQSTWRPIIRSILLAKGEANDIESIRHYQINQFARTGGEVACLELMPLPSQSTDEVRWHYREWSDLPALASRRAYLAQFMQARIEGLQALLSQHRPCAVVFYGASYQAYWENVSGCTFGNGVFPRRASKGAIAFLVLPHPAAPPFGRPPTSGAVHFVEAGHILRVVEAPCGETITRAMK